MTGLHRNGRSGVLATARAISWWPSLYIDVTRRPPGVIAAGLQSTHDHRTQDPPYRGIPRRGTGNRGVVARRQRRGARLCRASSLVTGGSPRTHRRHEAPVAPITPPPRCLILASLPLNQIGRASCRERV